MLRAVLLAALVAVSHPVGAQLFGEPELLEPEKAFRISARALDERNVEVEFKIADGYYMYRDRFSFATEAGKPLAEVAIPRGKIKEDQFFGKTETFRHLVRMRVPVSPEDAAQGRVRLKVTSQGCSDKGVCYTPLEQTVRVSLPGADTRPAQSPSSTSALALLQVPWLLLVASLGGGLAFGWASAGAPLVRDATVHLARGPILFWAAALAASGALFAWLGSFVPGRAENPFVAAPLALAYIAMAGLWLRWSMHAGEFNWPVRAARDVALLAAVLLFAIYLGEPWIGAATMLGAGLGCGLFPKARTEARHELALQAVALGMLAAGAWVAAPVLADELRMLAWAAWMIVTATMLRAIDPLRPFEGLSIAGKRFAEVAPVRFERMTSLTELEARIATAGRPVMLDFYADWCVSCKEMERFTFSDPQVAARMQRMLLLQVDVTRNSAEDQAILKRFKLFGPPGIIFFDAAGREIQALRVVGYQPATRFARVLDSVLARSDGGPG
jgi:thiol:disulfide interchange protein DsbD